MMEENGGSGIQAEGNSLLGGIVALIMGYAFTVGLWWSALDEGWELWMYGGMAIGALLLVVGTWLAILGAAQLDK